RLDRRSLDELLAFLREEETPSRDHDVTCAEQKAGITYLKPIPFHEIRSADAAKKRHQDQGTDQSPKRAEIRQDEQEDEDKRDGAVLRFPGPSRPRQEARM